MIICELWTFGIALRDFRCHIVASLLLILIKWKFDYEYDVHHTYSVTTLPQICSTGINNETFRFIDKIKSISIQRHWKDILIVSSVTPLLFLKVRTFNVIIDRWSYDDSKNIRINRLSGVRGFENSFEVHFIDPFCFRKEKIARVVAKNNDIIHYVYISFVLV